MILAAGIVYFFLGVPPDLPAECVPRVEEIASRADEATSGGDAEATERWLGALEDRAPTLLSPSEHLFLAGRADARGEIDRAAAEYRLAAAEAGPVGARIRDLEAREDAARIPSPAAAVTGTEARLAFAEGRHALAAGRLDEAAARLRRALRLSPGYVEAALALGAVEIRRGRRRSAEEAYAAAADADPDNVEALVSLADLLWDEPDADAKRESLRLLDRAAGLRPDLRELRRRSAQRWAAAGDRARALERLSAFRIGASPKELAETQALEESLRGGAASSAPTAPTAPTAAGAPSPALEKWKLARVYVGRGDPASLSAARQLLREAEELDPRFSPAPELEAAIAAAAGDRPASERALRRAIEAEPGRAPLREALARFLEEDPGRAAEAEKAWREAESTGSPEAAYRLALAAGRRGERARAIEGYRRYLALAPSGAHAAEASGEVAKDETRGRRSRGAVVGLFAVLAIGVVAGAIRRRGGSTLAEWTRTPENARQARPIVARLRHEAFKHGALFLSDAAGRVADPEFARLARERLEGPGGLVAAIEGAASELTVFARRSGSRLNLPGRDPIFAPLLASCRRLRGIRSDLERIEEGRGGVRHFRRCAAALSRAAFVLRPEAGREVAAIVDRALTTSARPSALVAQFETLAAERRRPLSVRVEGEHAETGFPVLVPSGDWETIWRNLFENVLDAAGGSETRAGIAAAPVRDPVTGRLSARFLLADDAPGEISDAMIHGRPSDRGLGIVAALVRRHGGTIEIASPPGPPRYRKALALEFPVAERA